MVKCDSFLEIGSQHQICEDFITSGYGFYNYVILSDGCSSSENTNCGAMILAQLAKEYLEFRKEELHLINYDEMGDWIIYNAEAIVKLLGLNLTCLDATLGVLYILDGQIYIHIYGDGYVIVVDKFGEIQVDKITFSFNSPYYLSYRIDFSRRGVYKAMNCSKTTKSSYLVKGHDSSRIEHYQLSSQYVLKASDFKEVYVASDGIDSFIRNGIKLPVEDVIKSFLDVERGSRDKNTKGVFIQRRCKKAIKMFRKVGWSHYDDISFGGFQLCHDTT